VVPLHRDIWAGGLAVLDVDPGGRAAHGRLVSEAWFMPARSQRLPGAAVDSAAGRASTTALSAHSIQCWSSYAFAISGFSWNRASARLQAALNSALRHVPLVGLVEVCRW